MDSLGLRVLCKGMLTYLRTDVSLCPASAVRLHVDVVGQKDDGSASMDHRKKQREASTGKKVTLG